MGPIKVLFDLDSDDEDLPMSNKFDEWNTCPSFHVARILQCCEQEENERAHKEHEEDWEPTISIDVGENKNHIRQESAKHHEQKCKHCLSTPLNLLHWLLKVAAWDVSRLYIE